MTANILWADDEIDLLRPHVLFLQGKGYTVDTVNNGLDAVEMVQKKEYDIVFLDENMPGLSGLETLDRINPKLRAQLQLIALWRCCARRITEASKHLCPSRA